MSLKNNAKKQIFQNLSNLSAFDPCLLMFLLVIGASPWFFVMIGVFNWHICMLHAPNYLHPPVESEGNYLTPRWPTMPLLSSVKADMPPERTSIHLLCLLNRQTRTHTHTHRNTGAAQYHWQWRIV